MELTKYFTDAVLRAPTIGCMLMCLAASLVGVVAFLRKQSLLGESLSHAAYPGLMLGVVLIGATFGLQTSSAAALLMIMGGAFATSLLGVWCIQVLERHFRIRSDSALCFVLSVFFGAGITLASRIQFAYPSLYKMSLTYLYGQAATMTDMHVFIYGILSLLILIFVVFLYKELQALTFDKEYSESLGIPASVIDVLVFVLLVFAVVVGIRSVGVVLMSAMLIAPAASARQYTNKLSTVFLLAAFFGLFSGFFGNVLSVELTKLFGRHYPSSRLALPTGPMIVVVASFICLFSLLFAPERGLAFRLIRMGLFRYRCLCENVLKTLWRLDKDREIELKTVADYLSVSNLYLKFVLWRLNNEGWVAKVRQNTYRLTEDGKQRAGRIIRLHRLWEVYLADFVGIGPDRVHRSAEEMEHIITPEVEQELTLLLHDPKKDPHMQPIPPGDK